MKIGITTPTGNIGSKLVDTLLKDESTDHELVLIARKPEKLRDADIGGAEIRKADQLDRQEVIEATEGLDVLFWVNPPKYDADNFLEYYLSLAENAAEAIKANEIPRVVLLSSLGANHDTGVGPVSALNKVEKVIRDAAENLVVLRPTFFFENFFTQLDSIKSEGTIYMPVSGDTKMPMIATRDIAETAARVVTEEFTGQEVRPLHGPRDYSFAETADIIGQAIGKDVNYVQVSPVQALEALQNMGASKDAAERFVEMYNAMETGRFQDDLPRTEESTTPTTLEDFTKLHLAPAVKA